MGYATHPDMSSFKREVPEEISYPLAVFAVDWMMVSASAIDEEGEENRDKEEESAVAKKTSFMTIHFSLYQHVMESEDLELETNKVQRWLRVAYLLENETENDRNIGNSVENDDARQESKSSLGSNSGGTLKILDFLPNAVAKCLGVKESDWVDLDYVRALFCSVNIPCCIMPCCDALRHIGLLRYFLQYSVSTGLSHTIASSL